MYVKVYDENMRLVGAQALTTPPTQHVKVYDFKKNLKEGTHHQIKEELVNQILEDAKKGVLSFFENVQFSAVSNIHGNLLAQIDWNNSREEDVEQGTIWLVFAEEGEIVCREISGRY